MPRGDGIMTTSFLGWRFWESGTLCFFPTNGIDLFAVFPNFRPFARGAS